MSKRNVLRFLFALSALAVVYVVVFLSKGKYSKTVDKVEQYAEVTTEEQIYIDSRCQLALKMYKEHQGLSDITKAAYEEIVALEFANFDEDKYLTGEVKQFIYECKN